MADRIKKDSTPPPLLLMPPGGGLTLTPPDQQNFLMPVVQSAMPAMLDPGSQADDGEEAEADSFVGGPAPASQPTGYFQSTGGSDPFSQVGPGVPPSFTPHTTSYAPAQIAATPAPVLPSDGPSTLPPPSALPPSISNMGGGGNMYRQKGGRPQYAPPPTGLLPAGPPSAPPTAMVPPLPPMPGKSPFSPPGVGNPPPPASHPISSQTHPQISNPVAQEPSGGYTGGLYYTPVRHHWCYRQDQGELEVWRPFSVLDSRSLEIAYNTRLHESPTILTNGGRYDVNVAKRSRTPVYWKEEPTSVMRCSWFYKREKDGRYIPYEEDFSQRLEDEYKKAMETNGWHRRLEFPGNVTIVMHNAKVIVQFAPSVTPDEWGNVQSVYPTMVDQTRPLVVKRGVDDFASIELGEREEVDHLVFFVPGIEDMFDIHGKSVEAFVDDFRSNALSLLGSHFTQAYQAKGVNRVEFLPVVWTQALNEGASGLKEQVGNVTLPSTSKLRHFINNTLVDTLFYTSPLYCQRICETVASEMNRMFHIFLERNISFSGDVSVAGHSLGSVILFDILFNQRMPGDPIPPPADKKSSPEPVDLAPPATDVSVNGDISDEESEGEEPTLEDLLARVGLQDKAALLQEEQMDIESLVMCSESDLKDLGLPMGPRKKLIGILKEQQEKKPSGYRHWQSNSKKKADRKIQREIINKQAELKAAAEAALAKQPKSNENENQVSADFIQGRFGAGQLKVTSPQLDFTPNALFALGSPIPVFLSLRGVQEIGEFFQLPTCPRVYNIFHPFDPMAYRMEPLIRQNTVSVKPVQIPHHKGRKRMHLEFKEAVTRYGTDIKQKLMDTFKSTWKTINQFARAHTEGDNKMENELQSDMSEMMSHIAQQEAHGDTASVSSMAEEEIHMGQLNEGQRVDYVLQEGPLESFNDYLFALASHSCYWESEDTALLLLREIYAPLGIRPKLPGDNSRESSLPPKPGLAPPPMTGATPGPSPTNFQAPPPVMSNLNNSASFSGPPMGASFQTPNPLVPPVRPPPPMFSPATQGAPPGHGMRRSPYVAPDFSNLPINQAGSPAGLPPTGPAPVGGYRRMPPN